MDQNKRKARWKGRQRLVVQKRDGQSRLRRMTKAYNSLNKDVSKQLLRRKIIDRKAQANGSTGYEVRANGDDYIASTQLARGGSTRKGRRAKTSGQAEGRSIIMGGNNRAEGRKETKADNTITTFLLHKSSDKGFRHEV